MVGRIVFDVTVTMGILAVIALPIASVLFFVTRKCLRWRSALWMALLVALSCLTGFFVSIVLNYDLSPVRFFDEAPLTRVVISLAFGALLGGSVACLALGILRPRS